VRRIIFHIGGSKCASTTLQGYFSRALAHETSDLSNEWRYKYFNIRPSAPGQNIVISGDEIDNWMRHFRYRYISSMGFESIKYGLRESLHAVQQACDNGVVPILSFEHWDFDILKHPEVKTILEDLDFAISVYLVVRPPVDWLNSAWWQWGAFTNLPVEEWARGKIIEADLNYDFYNAYREWENVKTVAEIKVVEISQDPLSQFQDWVKMPRSNQGNLNVRTHPALLEWLVKNKERTGRVVDPGVEFRLNEMLSLPVHPSPFVINHELCRGCIESVFENSVRLLDVIEAKADLPESVKRKYLELDFYDNREVLDIVDFVTKPQYIELVDSLLTKLL